MATVALVTAGKVTAMFEGVPPTVIRNRIAAEAITAGNAVYYTTTGKAGVADATSGGKEQFRGIALATVGTGSPVNILEEGECNGFAVSGINCDSILYLDTAGAIADAANGTKTVAVGRVEALADSPTNTRYLRVFTRPSANW
jgi:hypothetical protein